MAVEGTQVLKVVTLGLKVIVGLCAINFLVYLAGTMVLNGDALHSGSVSSGHFYITNHGRTKEITEGLFNYSRWHASIIKVTQPIFLSAMAGLLLIRFYRAK
jgi:hypothetical protein